MAAREVPISGPVPISGRRVAIVVEISRFHSSSGQDAKRLDRLCVTLKGLVAQVKEEMLCRSVRFWAEDHPIVG